MKYAVGPPLDLLGGGSEGLSGEMNQPENGQSGVGERSKHLGQTGSGGVVPILVPPTVFDEVQAVLHLPVAANVLLEIGGRDGVGIQAAHEIPTLARYKIAIGAA